MSLEKVVEEIRTRGRAVAEEIAASAALERERMLDEVREEAARLEEERKTEVRERISRQKLRESARAELEARRIGLQAQKEVLDDVLRQTKAHLKERPADRLLLEALVARHPDDTAEGTVHTTSREASLLKGLVGADVVGDLDAIGGFVVESPDETQRVDLTFETILEDLWQEVVKEIADLLWRQE